MRAMSIFEALPEIIREIQPISKTRTNQQQNYTFRGIEDVYAALNLLLAKYGVTIIPHSVRESSHEAFTTKSGAVMFRHLLKVQYLLTASDGSTLFAEAEGEGMDSGDKATAKAQSTAYKAMAFQLFCIPTGEKIDTEEDSPEVLPQNGHGKPAPADDKATVAAAELYNGFKDEIGLAPDADALAAIAKRIKEAHDAKKIGDVPRSLLLKEYAAKLKAVGSGAKASA